MNAEEKWRVVCLVRLVMADSLWQCPILQPNERVSPLQYAQEPKRSQNQGKANKTGEPEDQIANDGCKRPLYRWSLTVSNSSPPTNHASYLGLCDTRANLARDHACMFRYRLDVIMQLPEWMKPALVGAGAGAVALAVVGFGWGGWMTSSSAAEMSSERSTAAIATALTPYCVQNSKRDPKSTDILAKLKKAGSYQRRGIVEEAGWATPLGLEKPDSALAEACQIALTKDS